jgi:hypothetical protein
MGMLFSPSYVYIVGFYLIIIAIKVHDYHEPV